LNGGEENLGDEEAALKRSAQILREATEAVWP
jgi:hypothetical protein